MPGLLRGVARTAVVAGTASAVSNRVSRRQAQRWAQEDQSAYPQQAYAQPTYAEPAAAPQASPETDAIEQLTKLGQLRDSGVLTEEEFQAEKAKILGR
jgi:hypothetical protein